MSKEQRIKLWGRVKAEQDLASALALAADIAEEAIEESEKERTELRQELYELHKIIMGNGSPTNSLISRFERLESSVITLLGQYKNLELLLIGDISKGADNDSLLDKIKRNQAISMNSVRLAWLVLAAVVGDIVGHILKLL